MLISYRHSPFLDSLPPLYLSGVPIQLVLEFKYLGVTLSSSLSWSKHISLVCSKSRRLLDLLYCHFYHHSDPQTLLQLYTSLICPHLDYCSSIWDPHSPYLSASIERVWFFACKLCSKNWFASYHSLISTLKLPTLSSQCWHSKLILLNWYKLTDFPANLPPLLPSRSYSLRSFHSSNFSLQLSWTFSPST